MTETDALPPSSWVVIFNPAAGRGRAQKLRKRLIKLLEKRPEAVTFHMSRHARHARELAAEHKNDHAVVIAAGGDGTIHEVVNGLAGGRATLGILPMGSGNDFVKMLRLPGDLAGAFAVIERGKTLRIDLGRANGEYFPNSMGLGFDAEVVQESRNIRWLTGFPLYLVAVLKKLVTFRNRPVRMVGGPQLLEEPVFLITVSNGQYVGGGFRITPLARLDDGLLDVCVVRGLTLLETLRYLPRVIRGRHLDLPQVQYFHAKAVKVASPQPLPVQLDGELLETCPHQLTIEIIPRALTVIHNCDENETNSQP